MPGLSIFAVADPHAFTNERDDTMDRFTAIGKLALDRRPDVLVLLGDLGDFFHCRKDVEVVDGKLAWADCMAFKQALAMIMRPIELANEKHRKAGHKERCYTPRLIFCEGNHDARARYRKEMKGPAWEKVLPQYVAESLGFEWVPLNETIWLEPEPSGIGKIGFSHWQKSGAKKQAAAITAMQRKHKSYICGHEPILDLRFDYAGDGERLVFGKIGSCVPPDRVDPEAGEWSGAVWLSWAGGAGGWLPQPIGYDQMLETYGEAGYAQQLRTRRAQAAQDSENIAHAW
jgi:hypothetical protein